MNTRIGACTRNIGFVGLGNVGLPAALHFLGGGFQVTGYDIRPSQALTAAGGRMAGSLADLAGCDMVLQSLPSADALAQTIDGLLPGLRPAR